MLRTWDVKWFEQSEARLWGVEEVRNSHLGSCLISPGLDRGPWPKENLLLTRAWEMAMSIQLA